MGLFEYLFRRTKKPVTQASGTDGVGAMGGRLYSFEQNPAMQGRDFYTTLTNMIANTAIVGTGVRYFQNLIGGTSWTVEPKDGTGELGQRAADLVREGLFEANMPDAWSTTVKRAALFRMFGFSTHEWTMRRRNDGKMVFASIEHRPQATVEFWDIDDRGGPVRGIVQRPIVWGDYYYVPRERLLYCVDKSLTESPDGVGLLRHVVESARRLDRYVQLEGYGYETDLRGIPLARIPYQELEEYAKNKSKPKGWVADQVKPVEDFLQKHIRNPWMGLSIDSIPYIRDSNGKTEISTVPQWAIELLKSETTGLGEINVVIERLNREIARCLGMEFLMMGGDGKGSNAQHQDKTSMFAAILESTLHELAWFVVHDLVWPLLQMNGLDPEQVCPQVMPDPIATERIETVVDALSKLATAGAVLMPDDPAINQIRRRLHLAEQPDLPPDILGTLPQSRQPALAPEEPEDEAPAKPGARAVKSSFRVDADTVLSSVAVPRDKLTEIIEQLEGFASAETTKSWGQSELEYQRSRRAAILATRPLTAGEKRLFDALEAVAEDEAREE
jgi:hypothetical protein